MVEESHFTTQAMSHATVGLFSLCPGQLPREGIFDAVVEVAAMLGTLTAELDFFVCPPRFPTKVTFLAIEVRTRIVVSCRSTTAEVLLVAAPLLLLCRPIDGRTFSTIVRVASDADLCATPLLLVVGPFLLPMISASCAVFACETARGGATSDVCVVATPKLFLVRPHQGPPFGLVAAVKRLACNCLVFAAPMFLTIRPLELPIGMFVQAAVMECCQVAPKRMPTAAILLLLLAPMSVGAPELMQAVVVCAGDACMSTAPFLLGQRPVLLPMLVGAAIVPLRQGLGRIAGFG
mmetsp:Transcript_7159/g.16274  ORF Transcript_7159/g.16274 Transcript_7159/m.16274 type:complete len:292 (-) Transcript_7159:51-926(-)